MQTISLNIRLQNFTAKLVTLLRVGFLEVGQANLVSFDCIRVLASFVLERLFEFFEGLNMKLSAKSLFLIQLFLSQDPVVFQILLLFFKLNKNERT